MCWKRLLCALLIIAAVVSMSVAPVCAQAYEADGCLMLAEGDGKLPKYHIPELSPATCT